MRRLDRLRALLIQKDTKRDFQGMLTDWSLRALLIQKDTKHSSWNHHNCSSLRALLIQKDTKQLPSHKYENVV